LEENSVSKTIVSPNDTQTDTDPPPLPPKVLFLGGTHDAVVDLHGHLGTDVEIVQVASPVRVVSEFSRGDYAALYCDADHFTSASNVAQLIRNDRLLQELPDGVVMLDNENTILWSNGRLCTWSGQDEVIGQNFYRVLGSPEILGPDFCPLHTALSTGRASASNLRCNDNRFYRIHAAPVLEVGQAVPLNLVVSIHDISEEVLQQQKLAAIHQAGVELADLTTDEIANLSIEERIELLKSNILQCTQDVLQLDVLEIRMLRQDTKELIPILCVGFVPDAASRRLYAEKENNGVTGFVAATGKSYICEHTTEDPLYFEGAKGARSSLTVPLVLHDQVIGTFNVENPEPNAFTESDLQFFEIFARNVAVALNTLELLVAEKASSTAASVEAIHSAVALPVDQILNDAVKVMERYIGLEPDVVENLQRILSNARDIKRVIQKVGQSMTPTVASPNLLEAETRPALVGKRILVVDDDEAVRSAAHELLERYHCIVETAHDAHTACSLVRNLVDDASYDVIIADIQLPDMNGYKLLCKLKEISETVPLILMTGFGYDPGHSIVKARQAGLRSVLYKPFRLDQLIAAVEEIVAGNPAAPRDS
jgi:CheY-like chemotaxis protein